MIKSRPAHIVDRANFGVDHLHNQTFLMVYGCSHGSEEEHSRILDKTAVELARKRNLAIRMFKKQANSLVEVDLRAVISPGHFQTLFFLPATSSVLTGEVLVSPRRGQSYH